jgi:hypothetical protein
MKPAFRIFAVGLSLAACRDPRVMNQLVLINSPTLPALVVAAGERASIRFLEFFAANIRNPHTRRACRPP